MSKPVILYFNSRSFTVLSARTIKNHYQVINADFEVAHRNLTLNSFSIFENCFQMLEF